MNGYGINGNAELRSLPTHLSPRAGAWLLSRKATRQELKTFVCGEPFIKLGAHCFEQDVRAMVRGYNAVKFRPDEHDQSGWETAERFYRARGIQLPTCPECAVLLDELLQQTKQLHWRLWRQQEFETRHEQRRGMGKRTYAELVRKHLQLR